MAKIMGYPIFLPFRCHGQSLPCRRGIVFGQQIHTILDHADALPLGILSIGYRRFYRFSTGDAPRQIRVGHHKASFVAIFYNLYAVRQGKIFIQRFRWHLHFPQPV